MRVPEVLQKQNRMKNHTRLPVNQQYSCCNGEREAGRFKEMIILLDLVPLRHRWVLAPIWALPEQDIYIYI